MTIRYLPLRSLAVLLLGLASSVLLLSAIVSSTWTEFSVSYKRRSDGTAVTLASRVGAFGLSETECVGLSTCTTTHKCSGRADSVAEVCFGLPTLAVAAASGGASALISLMAPLVWWYRSGLFVAHLATIAAVVAMIASSVGYDSVISSGVGKKYRDAAVAETDGVSSHAVAAGFYRYLFGLLLSVAASLAVATKDACGTAGSLSVAVRRSASGLSFSLVRMPPARHNLVPYDDSSSDDAPPLPPQRTTAAGLRIMGVDDDTELQ